MKKFGNFIVKHKVFILILSFVLLIPSVIGYMNTKINYDILTYLPEDIETMIGQDILVDDFNIGAFSMIIVEGMEDKQVSSLKSQIEEVEHVQKVLWYDSILDLQVPIKMLPDEIKDAFNTETSTLMIALFDDTTSADTTMNAVKEIRQLTKDSVYVSGMSGISLDTKEIAEKETPIYVLIAGILSIIVLGLTMKSFLVPILFLLSIGMAILYNLGSNIMLGNICYITKALTAVLQLGVTMDYSIFLLHSYEENKNIYSDNDEAMSNAIVSTISSVVGSSITTVAGFIALCFMSFALGKDIGIVMSKGVIIGVICCITVLPSLILVFDKAIEKTSHKEIIPNLDKLSEFITKHYLVAVILFLIIMVPAIYGNSHVNVYYNLDASLPKTLPSIVANDKLSKEYQMNTTYMILMDNNLSRKEKSKMLQEISNINGVDAALGIGTILGPTVPDMMLPENLLSFIKSDDYEIALVTSTYKVATDEVNKQISEVSSIVKNYSDKSIVVGEGPLTKDLIDITAVDFKTVSFTSIGVIFIIILIIFKSISLPIILVSVIEFAIFVNMALSYYTGVTLPFVASIVIGTIQLGATVDYAILMTTRYKTERNNGLSKKEAIVISHKASIKSVISSALSFFAATIGVGFYSDIDMIGSLCKLMSRGAIISMIVVIIFLPSMFMVFDGLICKTSIGFGEKKSKNKKNQKLIQI